MSLKRFESWIPAIEKLSKLELIHLLVYHTLFFFSPYESFCWLEWIFSWGSLFGTVRYAKIPDGEDLMRVMAKTQILLERWLPLSQDYRECHQKDTPMATLSWLEGREKSPSNNFSTSCIIIQIYFEWALWSMNSLFFCHYTISHLMYTDQDKDLQVPFTLLFLE